MVSKKTIAAALVATAVLVHSATMTMVVNSMRARPDEWIRFIRNEIINEEAEQ